MSGRGSDEFEAQGESYNPDACWAAADRALAVLASHLLGVPVEARHHPTIVGPAEFVTAASAPAEKEEGCTT